MRRDRKRKLEMDDSDDSSHQTSSDNTSISHNHNRSNYSSPAKKRVKFDQSVNEDSSNDKYHKYESSSMHFPKLCNYLKVRVGDNPNLNDICYTADSNDVDTNNNNTTNNNKQLWLFHFPPGFDESSIHNLKLSIPQQPKSGQIITTFRINKQRYQIIEYDCSQNNVVNLFPVHHKLVIGQPFKRHFHILPDLRPAPNKRTKNKFMEKMKIQPVPYEDEDLFADDNNVKHVHNKNKHNDEEEDNVEHVHNQNENNDDEVRIRNEPRIEANHAINEEQIIEEQIEEHVTKHKKKKKKKSKKSLRPQMEEIMQENELIAIKNETETDENTKKTKKHKSKKDKKDKKKKKKHKRKSSTTNGTSSLEEELCVTPKKSKKKKSKKHKKSSKKKKKSKHRH